MLFLAALTVPAAGIDQSPSTLTNLLWSDLARLAAANRALLLALINLFQ